MSQVQSLRLLVAEKSGYRILDVYQDPKMNIIRFHLNLKEGKAVSEIFQDNQWREIHTLYPPLISQQTAMQRLMQATSRILVWPDS